MKLRPLGKKYWRAIYIFLIATPIAIISFHFDWYYICLISFLVAFIAAERILAIGLDSNWYKYSGYWGIRRQDPLYEYEPGDKDYEYEKQFQENDDPIEINIDATVTTSEEKSDGKAKGGEKSVPKA